MRLLLASSGAYIPEKPNCKVWHSVTLGYPDHRHFIDDGRRHGVPHGEHSISSGQSHFLDGW